MRMFEVWLRPTTRIIFECAGVQRAHVHFFCLPKRNEPEKRAPDDLPLAVARGSLRFSAKAGAAELTMLRMVQTVLASPGFVL